MWRCGCGGRALWRSLARSATVSCLTRAVRMAATSPQDDFVDIDALVAVDSAECASEEDGGTSALGVVRGVESEVVVRRSRLGLALSNAEDTTSSRDTKRLNSRAVQMADAAADKDDDNNGARDAGCALPYDDARFAETVLQMEVDGAIDEAWQDRRRAHLVDVQELTAVLRSMRVRDVVGIDVSGKTSNFDYMLFGTCESGRHIHLAAWAVQEADSLHRVSKVRRRRSDETWEVVPVGRIVVNLMLEHLRDELTLERKWAVTANMDPLTVANAPISEGRHVRAHGLWTLTVNLQDLEDFEVDYCKDVLLRQR